MRLHTSLLGAASLAALVTSSPLGAQGLAAVGATNPNHGFPEWYEDHNGLRLDACITDPVLCLLDFPTAPVLVDPNLPFPDNYGGLWSDHTFYFMAEAAMPTNNGGQALLVLTIQGGFLNDAGPVNGEQEVFARFRVRVDNLVDGGSYTVTTPFGVYNFIAAGAGVRGINFTDDVGRGVPGVFDGALPGAIGPFLQWNADLPILDGNGREYIGNPTIEHAVTGSPIGQNVFRVQGPSVGGPGVNSIETDLFAVLGVKAQDVVVVPAPVAAFSSAPNSGVAPLNVSFTDLTTGDVTSWLWDFGDGASSTLQNPTHAYAAGTFSVSLTATGPGGSSTSTQANVIAVANDPGPVGMVLANPVPGTAGVPNSYVVTGCTPGRQVGIYSGLQLGASIVNQGRCGGIPIGLASPFRLIGKARVAANGVATIVATPPASSAGRTFHAQAVEPTSCRTSNVVSEVF